MKRFYEAHGAIKHTVLFSTGFFQQNPEGNRLHKFLTS